MPTSFRENIPVILKSIEESNPKTVLDVGFGRGKYGFLIKEYYPHMKVDGLEVFAPYITPIQENIYENILKQNIFELEAIPPYDLYLLIDVVEHWNLQEAKEIIKKMLVHGNVLISTPRSVAPQGPEYGNEWERHVSQWQGEYFEAFGRHKDYHNEISFIFLLKKHE